MQYRTASYPQHRDTVMKNIQTLKIEDINEGMKKVLNNASSLIEDSELLYKSNKYPRSYTLAHLSIEEIAKLPMLFRIGTLIKINETIDWKKFWDNFGKHNKKLLNNLFWSFLYFSNNSPNINIESFLNDSIKVISKKNDLKNNSLYVGFIGNKFIEPSETILEHRAQIILELSKRTYKLAEALMSNFIEGLEKTEEEIIKQFEKMELSKDNLAEFLNRFEDIIISLAQKNGTTHNLS